MTCNYWRYVIFYTLTASSQPLSFVIHHCPFFSHLFLDTFKMETINPILLWVKNVDTFFFSHGSLMSAIQKCDAFCHQNDRELAMTDITVMSFKEKMLLFVKLEKNGDPPLDAHHLGIIFCSNCHLFQIFAPKVRHMGKVRIEPN